MNSFDLRPQTYRDRLLAKWKSDTRELEKAVPGAVLNLYWPNEVNTDLLIIEVAIERWVETLAALCTLDCGNYKFIIDYTATDELPRGERFNLVMHLMDLSSKVSIRVKTKVNENCPAPTLIPLWPSANWAEREIYDMFGIVFSGHPDLRRIIMDLRWQGHPLRKDYPLRGYQCFTSPEKIDESVLDRS